MLNLIGGLDKPTNGKIFFDGKSIEDFTDNEWARFRKHNIGFVFQNFNLIPHLTAIENVEISMTLTGLSKNDRRTKAKELLTMVGLENRLHYRPNRLSGGQKQRVAIARALANDPDIILADEPTGALDSQTAIQIMDILKQIAASGKLVIVVTHDLELAERGNRIIKMQDGHIVEEITKGSISPETFQDPVQNKKDSSLSLGTAFKMALQNIKQKKWRIGLTAFGASIGICGIALLVGLGIGVQQKVKDELSQFAQQNTISVRADKDSSKPITTDKVNRIKHLKQVSRVTYSETFMGVIGSKEKADSASTFSLDPYSLRKEFEKKQLLKGEYPKNKDNAILLSEKTVKSLYGEKKSYSSVVGKQVQVTVQLVTNTGANHPIEKQLKIAGITKDGPFGLAVAYLPYDTSIQLAQKSAREKNPYTLTVATNSTQDIDSVKKKIKSMELYADSDSEAIDKVNMYFKMVQVGLGLFASISLVVSSIMIGIVLYISVLERTREIGILKALGARKKDIRRIFISEAALIGLIGGVLGVIGASVLGVAGNAILEGFLKKQSFQAFVLPGGLIAFCIAFSMLISMFAGLIPARKASSQNPVEALRYE